MLESVQNHLFSAFYQIHAEAGAYLSDSRRIFAAYRPSMTIPSIDQSFIMVDTWRLSRFVHHYRV